MNHLDAGDSLVGLFVIGQCTILGLCQLKPALFAGWPFPLVMFFPVWGINLLLGFNDQRTFCHFKKKLYQDINEIL